MDMNPESVNPAAFGTPRPLATRPMRIEPRLKPRGTQLAGWSPKPSTAAPAGGILFDEDVPVPMPDGVVLLADLFRPAGMGPVPVLVSWAVYVKDTERMGGGPFIDESGVCPMVIKAGYAILRVQPRGTGRSGGIAPNEMACPDEAWDCHHAIEWAARQAWCNGVVGMTGMSYFAIAQLQVAATRPPSLKAIFPYKAMTDMYRHGFYKGGAAYSGIIELFAAFEKLVPPKIPSALRHTLSYILNRKRFEMAMSDPVATEKKIRKFLRAKPPGEAAVLAYVSRMFDRVYDDADYWRSKSISPKISDIEVPVCIATDYGAQDLHFFGAFELWHRLRGQKFLFFGPPEYVFPWSNYQHELLAWYDWQLKGIDNGYAALPPVRYWLRGAERWEHAQDWPVPGFKPTPLFLAKTSSNPLDDQALAPAPGAAESQSYLAIPSTSYYVAQIDRYEAQILRWCTAPFPADTQVVGPVKLMLHFIATALDTYFVARLSDLAPDGRRRKLSWGWLLASQRRIDTARSNPTEIVHDHSSAALCPLLPGKPTQILFSLNPIANQFNAGHRLVLEIASRPELLASEAGEGFDMFHWDPVPYRSRNTILCGGTEPSYLEICVKA